MPKVELSVGELEVLHKALQEFMESGSSGLEDCECRLIYDRVHKILSWGSGHHLPYRGPTGLPKK